MQENIEHPGIISRVENGRVWVTIQPQSACGSCHSKTYCGMAEVAEKIVEVGNVREDINYLTGQLVTISLKKSLGYRALMLGYLLPFLLLMAVLITSVALTGNEGLSALLAIFVIIPYYLALYYKRDVIKSSFRFFIR
jgi:sigma-E factor negative regulatory protein RseC